MIITPPNDATAKTCPCGQQGCVEAYASARRYPLNPTLPTQLSSLPNCPLYPTILSTQLSSQPNCLLYPSCQPIHSIPPVKTSFRPTLLPHYSTAKRMREEIKSAEAQYFLGAPLPPRNPFPPLVQTHL